MKKILLIGYVLFITTLLILTLGAFAQLTEKIVSQFNHFEQTVRDNQR